MAAPQTIEAFVVDTIREAPVLADIPGCPLSVDARRLLLANCPVYMVEPSAETPNYLSFDTRPAPANPYLSDLAMWQPGPHHNRSFALDGPGLAEPWQDEYDNTYSSFTLKGVNFTNPGIMEHPVSTDGVVAWGLQESKIISRVLAASEVLTGRGVSTERIIGLAEPKEYPWPLIDKHTDAHAYLPLATYKQRIVEQYWRQLPGVDQTVDTLADLTRKFSDMTFYISLRATDTAYRLADAEGDAARAQLFDQINRYYMPPGQELDAQSARDMSRYVAEFFAPRAGKTLAVLHEDLAHGFANGLNWTGLGGIVDLDSVHGEGLGLGDSPVTMLERTKDIIATLRAIKIAAPQEAHIILRPNEHARGAMQNFLNNYFDETIARLGDNDQTVEYLGELIHNLNPAAYELSSDELDDGIIETACSLYYDRFFRQKYDCQLTEAHAPLTAAVAELIETDEQFVKDIIDPIYSHMPHYGALIVDDYLNELIDPSFDAVDAFVHDGQHTTAWATIAQDIMQEILLQAAQSAAVNAVAPNCIRTIQNPDVRVLLIGILLSELGLTIEKHAIEVTAAHIPLFADSLRQCIDFERPEPLFGGEYPSRPNTGLAPKHFWMATEAVQTNSVAAYLQHYEGPLDVIPLRDASLFNRLELSISGHDRIREIITDGLIDGTSIRADGSDGIALTLFLEAGSAQYVLLVGADDQDNKQLILLASDFDNLLPRAPQSTQAVLF